MRTVPDVIPENAVPQYEALRRYVLGEAAGSSERPGVALVMHKGMSAWMRVWSDCTKPSEAVTTTEPPAPDLVPRHLQPEVIMILAGMALNRYPEVA